MRGRILVFLSLLMVAVSGASDPDFAREVLPILSNKCFVCHGPDAKEGELRLDSFEAATVDLGGYRAIDPDDPGNSELIHRIHDAGDPMPPKKAEKSLTPAEREVLTRWAKSGGAFSRHWAYVRPEKPEGETIDSLVGAALREKGVDFSPEAAPSVLARRAALVLTGLPPERDQLDRFLKNPSGEAYGRLVDELLASPRFGEHRARYWLDAVRYGDTHGLHLDNRRGIFPYRDWVVHAFNENLPFDDFIVWQLAGDLLESPSLEQLTATGYVRMNPTTSEGGAIAAEFQAKNNFDRTENLGTVFLGMTLNCARCHTHKYDPVTQEEYYRLFAFFNSTAESPLDGNAYRYPPVLEVPASRAAWIEWRSLKKRQDALVREIGKTAREMLPSLIDHAQGTLSWKTGDWRVSKKDVPWSAPQPAEEEWKEIGNGGALARERFGGNDKAKWVSFTLSVPRPQTLLYRAGAGPDSELIASLECLPRNQTLARLHPGAGETRVVAKLQGLDGRSKAEISLHNPWESLAGKRNWEAVDPLDQLLIASERGLDFFPENLRQRAAVLCDAILVAKSRFVTTLVAKDLPNPRSTRLLERGEYDRPVGDGLEPDVFGVLNPLPEGAPKNRMGLARWLISPENPLVTRVLVNRFWQSIFGSGIVRSPEDFGLQGRFPTHPDLLDWLAVEFRESGWDHKALIRKMVMSRTFRQDSAWRPGVPDPDNLRLARGPSYRLDAEVIRDLGLWAGGLLRPYMGGEGVKPYQPEGMWAALAHPASNTKLYVPDTGDRVFRRSLYVYWKRTSPHPMMTLFDAPNRESSCVRRSRGNTPLQSLGLFNEPQRLMMARAFAARLTGREGGDGERLDEAYRILTCRPGSEAERRACLDLLERARERYRKRPEDASSLTGLDSSSPGLADRAAWTQLATTLLASDASILLY